MSKNLAPTFDDLFGAEPPPKDPASCGREVLQCDDWNRIDALPRREKPEIDIELLSKWLRTPQGTQTLKPVQAHILSDLFDFGGCFAVVPVGGGKTLPSVLGGTVVNAKRPLLLVPADLMHKTNAELPTIRQHWRVSENLTILSNGILQHPKYHDILERLNPDFIAIDECQDYKNKKSARCLRLEAFIRRHPMVPLLTMTGTPTSGTILDYWHLARWTMKRYCPMPVSYNTAKTWHLALDVNVPDENRYAPGALMLWAKPGQNHRQGYHNRLSSTPSLIADFTTFGGPLNLHLLESPKIPKALEEAFEMLREKGETLYGDVIPDAQTQWRRCREMAWGGYYRWMWPGGVVDMEWVDARKWWRSFAGYTVRHNQLGLDSIFRVEEALKGGHLDGRYLKTHPAFKTDKKLALGTKLYADWVAVKDRFAPHKSPPKEMVWITKDILEQVAGFEGITWVEHEAVGQELARISGFPYFGAGKASSVEILTYKKPCIASIFAHSKGKNLQHNHHRNLMLAYPSSGAIWDQCLGRTHRDGQRHTVDVYLYMHCVEMFKSYVHAQKSVEYIQDTLGTPQKLNLATKLFTDADLLRSPTVGTPLWPTDGTKKDFLDDNSEKQSE